MKSSIVNHWSLSTTFSVLGQLLKSLFPVLDILKTPLVIYMCRICCTKSKTMFYSCLSSSPLILTTIYITLQILPSSNLKQFEYKKAYLYKDSQLIFSALSPFHCK